MNTARDLQAPFELLTSTTIAFITTTVPDSRTTISFPSTRPTSSSIPLPPSEDPDGQQTPVLTRYRFAIGILVTVIGVALILLAIIFMYVKPKKWKAKGAASNDAELQQLKRENEDLKHGAGFNARMPPMPGPVLGVGPRGWW